MKKIYKGFVLLFLITSCTPNLSVTPSEFPIEETLGLLLKEALDNSYGSIPGITMTIISPDLPQGKWSGAAGYDSKEKDHPVSVEQPFRIASVTKTFVAMAILRLHEMDRISIDDPISKYISPEHIEILKSDNYNPDEILIRHCLNHTSGLFDYAGNHDAYISACIKDPQRRWTRTDQLKGAIKWGDKVGYPGERYTYSDTGYILLGEIIELFSDGDLAKGLRQLLKFNQLGLTDTWLETLEPAPDTSYMAVHRYLGRIDATDFDASVDLYGGGGLMSTSMDLSTFIKALFNHQVFDKKETLELMKTKPVYGDSYIPEDDKRHHDYRYGVWQFQIYGEEAYMHQGLWGVYMIHIPGLEMSIGANFTAGIHERMIKKAVLAIIEHSKAKN